MYCFHCGTQIDENGSFCKKCGARVAQPVAAVPPTGPGRSVPAAAPPRPPIMAGPQPATAPNRCAVCGAAVKTGDRYARSAESRLRPAGRRRHIPLCRSDRTPLCRSRPDRRRLRRGFTVPLPDRHRRRRSRPRTVITPPAVPRTRQAGSEAPCPRTPSEYEKRGG
jgi:hypothetical protein